MRHFFYEKKKAFSIRKLSIGAASICIGTGLLLATMPSQPVEAQDLLASQEKTVHFQYVLESELTVEERARIVGNLPTQVIQEATYFLVYRPHSSAPLLPATGQQISYGVSLLGAAFLVIAVSAVKSKKARIAGLLYITIGGATLPVLQVEALQSQALSAYNQTYILRTGASLPDGRLRIAGYDFVGYIVENGKQLETRDSQAEAGLIIDQPVKEENLPDQVKEESGNSTEAQSTAVIPPSAEETDKAGAGLEQPNLSLEKRYREEVTELAFGIEEYEDASLPLGEERIVAGVAGQRIDRYEEVWSEGQLSSSFLVESREIPAKNQLVYKGTRAEVSSEETLTSLPEVSPTIAPAPVLEYDLRERVAEATLPIPEEYIETDRLLVGESEIAEGQAGLVQIVYQDLVIDGQVVASNELSRTETASVSRKVYVGTRVAEEAPSQPVEETLTSLPEVAPTTASAPVLEYELHERVAEEMLPIPEERIETDRLLVGETEIVEGQAGTVQIVYQDLVVDGQVVASNELSRTETASVSRKVYVGTRVVEEAPSQPVEETLTVLPEVAPTTAPAPVLEYELHERVAEEMLPIPEERIATDRLLVGETEIVEGQAGTVQIVYQDVMVDGQVVASNELSRTETASVSRKVYVGTRVAEETAPSQPVEEMTTSLPEVAPTIASAPVLEYELHERVAEEILPIPEERIETDRLLVGESEIVEGRSGTVQIVYQDLVIDGQLIASNELSRTETASVSRKIYVGTRVAEETAPSQPVEETLTSLPEVAPTTAPAPILEYELCERVAEEILPIPEERIETDRLLVGEREVVEGQAGTVQIVYQDVIIDGQVVASNELSRTETASVSRKVYVGTRVDDKPVAPLYQELPAQVKLSVVEEEVAFDYREEIRQDWEEGRVEIVPGVVGRNRVTYGELNGNITKLATEEILAPQVQVTYRGSRQDEKIVPPLYTSLPEATIRQVEESVDFEIREEDRPDWPLGQVEIMAGRPGRNLVTYADLNGTTTRLAVQELEAPQAQVTYRGSRQDEKIVPPLYTSLPEATLRQVEESVDFEIREEDRPDWPLGQVEIMAGRPGRNLVTYADLDGTTTRLAVQELEAPQSQVTYRGSRQDEKAVPPLYTSLPEASLRQVEESVDFTSREESRPDWPLGQVEVVAGRPGRNLVTYADLNGTRTRLAVQELEAPQDQITYRGSRQDEKAVPPLYTSLLEAILRQVEESVDFASREEDRPDWPLGQVEVVTGRPGRNLVTYADLNGTRTRLAVQELEAPQDQITYRGSRQDEKIVPPLYTSYPEASLRQVEESVDFTSREESRPDWPLGQVEVEAGRPGRNLVTYADLNGTTTRLAVQELEAPQDQITYRGSRQDEKAVPPLYTNLPEARLRQVEESVDFASREEDRPDWPLGQVEVVTGRPGRNLVTYADLNGTRTRLAVQELEAPQDQITYRGSRQDEKVVPPLYTSLPEATLRQVEESVEFGSREEDRPDWSLGQVEVVAGRPGRNLVTYADLNGTRTRLAVQEIEAPQAQVTYRGSRQDEKVVPPLYTSLPEATIRQVEESVDFEIREEDRPDWPLGQVEIEAGRPGRNLVTYADLDGTTTRLAVQEIEAPQDQITYRGTQPITPTQPEVPTPPTEQIKPTLTLLRHQVNPEAKTVDIEYSLDDPSTRYRSAKAGLYVGEELVAESDLTRMDTHLQARFTDLKANVDYTVRAELTYSNGPDSLTDSVADLVSFDIEERRLEIKDIEQAELWRYENGRAIRVLSLEQVPGDVTNYVAKIRSDEQKEIYLPVSAIQATRVDNQAVYQITTRLENLVEDRNLDSSYSEGLTFFIARRNAESRLVTYTSFGQLIEAINRNPNGTFELTGDLTASDYQAPSGSVSYVTQKFTGILRGNGYSLYDLTAPLFAHLGNGARISQLNLKAVSIHEPTAQRIGALARESYDANVEIDQVRVEGNITASDNIGGLVGHFSSGQIRRSAYTGAIRSLTVESNDNRLGGIAAWLGNGGRIEQAVSDARIFSIASGTKIGGIVGQVDSPSLVQKVYSKGMIVSASSTDTENGGLVGSMMSQENRRNTLAQGITEVKVLQGNAAYGFELDNLSAIRELYVVDRALVGKPDKHAQIVSADRLDDFLNSYGLTDLLAPTDRLTALNRLDSRYDQQAYQDVSRAQAYQNLEKLLPFYTKDIIVQQGNRLAARDSLVTKVLLAARPMIDDRIVYDLQTHSNHINRLLLHFADGTLEYVPLTRRTDLVVNGGAISEFYLADRSILYTPDTYLTAGLSIQEQSNLVAELRTLDYDSPTVQTALRLGNRPDYDLANLFLRDSFNQVKQEVDRHLGELLSANWLIGPSQASSQAALVDYIRNHKAEFLLGLAYMNRWYNIQYGLFNAKDTMIKDGYFFGQGTNSLENIISLGSLGKDVLRPKHNYVVGSGHIAAPSIKGSLFTYLETYRKLFAKDLTDSQWFNQSTKAYILETKSEVASARAKQDNPTSPYHHVEVYKKITSQPWRFKEMALILLNMESEGVFLVSNMTSLFLGMYEHNIKEWTQAEYDKLKVRVQQAGKQWRDHSDFWYNILPASHKEKMFSHVINWDSRLIRGQWLSLLDPTPSMRNFFGPLGYENKHYEGTFAYSLGFDNVFDCIDMMGERAASTYTHELTHVLEDDVYLLGYSRRNGLSPEVFADGLFQSNPWSDQDRLTINSLLDHSDKESALRLTNLNPQRFASTQDLEDYMRGYFDVLYSLDYLEAEAVMKQNPYVKENWFKQLTTLDGNRAEIRKLADGTSYNSIDDLIDKGMISRRFYDPEGQADSINYPAGHYHSLSALDPLYGAVGNNGTSRNEMDFRKLAFEFLAEFGYVKGLVPYASNQYRTEFGYLSSDSQVIHKLSEGLYADAAAFRKAMFARRIDNLGRLKAVTITGKADGGYYHGASTQVTSLAQLRKLMADAVQHDANWHQYYGQASHYSKEKSRVYGLKAALLNAYLLETNDFRTSIYN